MTASPSSISSLTEIPYKCGDLQDEASTEASDDEHFDIENPIEVVHRIYQNNFVCVIQEERHLKYIMNLLNTRASAEKENIIQHLRFLIHNKIQDLLTTTNGVILLCEMIDAMTSLGMCVSDIIVELNSILINTSLFGLDSLISIIWKIVFTNKRKAQLLIYTVVDKVLREFTTDINESWIELTAFALDTWYNTFYKQIITQMFYNPTMMLHKPFVVNVLASLLSDDNPIVRELLEEYFIPRDNFGKYDFQQYEHNKIPSNYTSCYLMHDPDYADVIRLLMKLGYASTIKDYANISKSDLLLSIIDYSELRQDV